MINDKLSAVQIEALSSLYNSFENKINPICAVGTGSGKSWIACEIIQNIINNNMENYRILIIHKASNHNDPWLKELRYYNFIREVQDIRPSYLYIHGKNRDKILFGGKYHFHKQIILLTSYETLRLDIEHHYYDFTEPFDLIIYDELHTIINYKRLTKRSKLIYLLQAIKKLALTASPMNNHKYEFGILYAFLNDSKGFSELIKHYSKIDNEEYNKEKKEVLENKLDEYNNICLIKNFIFYFVEKKSGFQKNAVILSLPIDENMLLQANEMSKSYIPKQRRFLSHPAAVFKNVDKSTLPRCTKEDTIRIILQSMLKNEKAVIFSQFIDVLNVYADICHNLGFPSIIITGNDKGEKLKRKLIEFEYAASIKVLLTTLQKSAEGFNFPFATHVIILELWWNPQKIIQAMSRIDRKTQERNIFIYILCYNDSQKMIKYEESFYKKMVQKLNDANYFFQENEKIHPIKNPLLQTLYTEIPEMKIFSNIGTFQYELNSYITQFQHTSKFEYITHDEKGHELIQTKNKLINEANNYLYFSSILKNTPWRINREEVKSFLSSFYIDNH